MKPLNTHFSSGPTSKRPGWTGIDKLEPLGRSHRSTLGVERISYAVDLTRQVLEIPESYLIGIIPGGCTGAMETALWNLLGPNPVDFISFDVFGKLWVQDGLQELKLKDSRTLSAEPGYLPNLSQVNPAHDVVLTWNGTTTGVAIPNGEWISDRRTGLVICDAISALFAMRVPWDKLDVVAFSWQKGIGSEGAHGMLVLSPRAVQRIESYTPPWPIPRLFRLKHEGAFAKRIFEGMTINTPSLLCVEDYTQALLWAKKLGGLDPLIERSKNNLKAVEDWAHHTPWIEFMAKDPASRSSTSICLRFPEDPENWTLPKKIAHLLEAEGIAFDILGHLGSKPCLRIWGGPTIETKDIQALLPWITWAYGESH